jgi:hypothetical protein
MKVHPSIQSTLMLLLCHAIWLVVLAFCLLYAGCFSPRDYSAWSNPDKSAIQHAILPVLPTQVRITVASSESYEISLANSNVSNKKEVARIINEVLDTIAAAENNSLEGPGKVNTALKQSPNWRNFQVYIQDTGPLHEAWKREGLAKISRELGYKRVLCVNPTLRFQPNLSFIMHENNPFHQHWDGRITVTVNMMELATAQVFASGVGEADFYGNAGIWGFGGAGGVILIPFAYGKAFDHAVDQAIRKALAELFVLQSKGGTAK